MDHSTAVRGPHLATPNEFSGSCSYRELITLTSQIWGCLGYKDYNVIPEKHLISVESRRKNCWWQNERFDRVLSTKYARVEELGYSWLSLKMRQGVPSSRKEITPCRKFIKGNMGQRTHPRLDRLQIVSAGSFRHLSSTHFHRGE